MRMIIGPKQWTWNTQKGLRLFADPIRQLATELTFPDRRGLYTTLQEFLDAIDASAGSATRPTVYSRRVLMVRLGEVTLSCTTSISDNTDRRPAALAGHRQPSVQGYVTAPQGTWFFQWVQQHVGGRIVFDYLATPNVDFIVVP